MPFKFKRPERSRYAAASTARTCALPLYVGMRLLLCSKECVRLRLMNGTLCELVDIVFADEEALPSSEFAGEPILLEFLPVQLLLRAVDAERVLPRSLLPDLPDDVDRRGLFPLEKHTDSFPPAHREGRQAPHPQNAPDRRSASTKRICEGMPWTSGK